MAEVLALEVQGIGKSFGEKQILQDISFGVPSSQITGLIGFNGAGKSTLLKCIVGLLIPDSGQVFFFGERRAPKSMMAIGYLPERPGFPDFMTPLDFLWHHWCLSEPQGKPNSKEFTHRADELLRRLKLDLHKDRRINGFSKGMRQRLGLAQALLRNPRLLILDEPFSGLDLEGRLFLKQLMLECRDSGIAVFFTSHALFEIFGLCEEIVVLHRHRLQFKGKTLDFLPDSSGAKEILEQSQTLESKFIARLDSLNV